MAPPPTYGPNKPKHPRDRFPPKRSEPEPEPEPEPELDPSTSSASMETLEIQLKKIQKELESRRREDTGVYKIKTRELTDELADAFKKYHETADVVVNAALRTAIKRVVVAVLGVVTAVATIAVGYVRLTPSPESEEVKKTVDDQSSVLKDQNDKQDARIGAVEEKLDAALDGIKLLGEKLDAEKAALEEEQDEPPKKRRSSAPKPRSGDPG